MAIKGKSRKRSKPKPPALPPRPAIGSRKTPLPMRRDVKRFAVVVLAVLAFLGGLRVWQNVARGNAVRSYDRKLSAAQIPLISHLQPGSPTAFDDNIQAFSGGTVSAQGFLDLTAQWEKDFRAAEGAVKKLKPPNKVAEDAQFLIAQGIEGYVGIARLLNLAAQFRQLADAEQDAAKKKVLNEKVQVILQHADEWRKQRSDLVYSCGANMLNSLKVRYGLEEPLPSQGSCQ